MKKKKTRKKSGLNFTKNENWLRKMADAEEKAGCVSVGGLHHLRSAKSK